MRIGETGPVTRVVPICSVGAGVAVAFTIIRAGFPGAGVAYGDSKIRPMADG